MNKNNIVFPINKLALIGVGMIGGSFIWSLKRAGLVNHVVGVDVNVDELQTAEELGIIDSKSSIEGLADIDVVVIATPVGVMETVFTALKEKSFISTALITDVGSTKQSVINAAIAGIGYLPENFVPSHPIAGREHIGIVHAEEMMFHGYRAIVTPHEKSSLCAIEAVTKLWEGCGARVDIMSAQNHDKILAATSHLPHVLAYGLMESLTTTEYEEPIFDYAAGGFKSFTRTASSNPIMWRDICLNNKDEILYWLEQYQNTLSSLREFIKHGDGEAILDVFERSKKERDEHFLNKYN
ncbi:MAG: prephenate dehydrogenase/arogenate dehydrogenase family protein [Gammaproteobacteria bacterium]|nr:prephenate dehydrogenase/arogenate dehydrogenase family protein [Gammaproteobacteria bacterium]